MSQFDHVIDPLIKAEGGLRIHKQEPGGASKYGISLVTLRKYHGNQDLQIADFEFFTPSHAKDIYKVLFWDKFKGDQIRGALTAHLAFDQVANRGIEGFRNLLIGCLNNRYKHAFMPGAAYEEMWEAANEIPDRKFFRRLLADAQHSYEEIGFRKFRQGEWTLDEMEETLKIWRIRTHNLMKLLEEEAPPF